MKKISLLYININGAEYTDVNEEFRFKHIVKTTSKQSDPTSGGIYATIKFTHEGNNYEYRYSY